ncbi:hypothetical protein ACWELJ_21325 [Nocardia sp. NPDC004582]
MDHRSEDIARPEHATTESARVLSSSHSVTTVPAAAAGAENLRDWYDTIEAALGGRYRGSRPDSRRRGQAKCPPKIVRGRVCGHQCTAISPRVIAAMGGIDAACRRLCRVQLVAHEDDAPTAVVHCWDDRASFLRSCDHEYDAQYSKIRPILVRRTAGKKSTGGGVSKRAFMKVVQVMAGAADHGTGRNSRLTNAAIAEQTGLKARQVGRAKMAMLLLGVATEVMRGRQRTLVERMASWKVGDKSRGWASVWSLHPPRGARPVDKPVGKSKRISAGQSKMATHLERFSPPAGRGKISSGSHFGLNCGKGASRSIDKSGAEWESTVPNQRGLILALRWLGDARTPRWAHRYSPNAWADVLGPAAEFDWRPEDLHRELRPRGEVLHPLSYVRRMLEKVDLAWPQIIRAGDEARAEEAAKIERAAAAGVEAVRKAIQDERDQRREEALNGDGRKAAMAARQTLGEASEKRRQEGRQFDSRAYRKRLRESRNQR